MAYTELVLAYNKKIQEALKILYTALPPGQQKTVLKNEEIRKLLTKYRVVDAS